MTKDRNSAITIYGGRVEARAGEIDNDGNSNVPCAGFGVVGNNSMHVYSGDVYAYGVEGTVGIGGGDGYTSGTNLGEGDGGTINGGTVIAYAGSDVGDKNGSAIGSEDGDGHRGTLRIDSTLMVHAGQSPSASNYSLFTAAEREPACFCRPYARIEPCNHQGSTYTINGTTADGTHTLQCSHCLAGGTPETHDFVDGECTVCHVHGEICTVSVYTPQGEIIYYAYGNTPRYTDTVVKGSTLELPEAALNYLPRGVRFVG